VSSPSATATTRTSPRSSCSSWRWRGAGRSTSTSSPDEGGNHLVDLRVTFDVTFPEGEAGDAARAVLESAIQRSQDRLCTVGRTVTLGDPVRYTSGTVS